MWPAPGDRRPDLLRQAAGCYPGSSSTRRSPHHGRPRLRHDLGRHDFASALTWGTRAARANPDLPDALGVIFDAQVELGRYQAAVVTAQAMVDRKPAQGSLARVSYARELLGDPAGAVAAMVQAAAAGGDSPADRAYVQTLIGNLHLGAGRLAPAEAAYRRALDGLPSYGLAEVGMARVAAARGNLAGAARLLEPAAARLPLPATVALLGDVAPPGRHQGATAQYQAVRVIERLNRPTGWRRLELARFEATIAADPGARRRAVAMSRRAWPTADISPPHPRWALRQLPTRPTSPTPVRGPARLPRRAPGTPGRRRCRPRMPATARRHLAEAFGSALPTVRASHRAGPVRLLHLPPKPDERR